MKQLRYPLIVSDFDGTLLKSDGTIDKITLDAIDDYRAAGGHFALCTGRMLASALLVANRLGLKGLVSAFQGSVVADIESGELVVDGFMDTEGAVEICRCLESLNLHVHIYCADCYYSNMADEALSYYEKIVGVKATIKTDEPFSQFIEREQLKIRKILIMLPSEEKMKVYNHLGKLFGERYYVTYSAEFLVEISNRDYSKATALKKIAEYYQVALSETIAVGDSLNDLPMIEAAGLGIAVGNATEQLKNFADVALRSTNDENAISEIIHKFGFSKK